MKGERGAGEERKSEVNEWHRRWREKEEEGGENLRGRKGRPQEGLDVKRLRADETLWSGTCCDAGIGDGEVADRISVWKLLGKEGVMERYLRRR